MIMNNDIELNFEKHCSLPLSGHIKLIKVVVVYNNNNNNIVEEKVNDLTRCAAPRNNISFCLLSFLL